MRIREKLRRRCVSRRGRSAAKKAQKLIQVRQVSAALAEQTVERLQLAQILSACVVRVLRIQLSERKRILSRLVLLLRVERRHLIRELRLGDSQLLRELLFLKTEILLVLLRLLLKVLLELLVLKLLPLILQPKLSLLVSALLSELGVIETKILSELVGLLCHLGTRKCILHGRLLETSLR